MTARRTRGLLAALLLLALAGPASAATHRGYAAWGPFTGSSGAYTGSVQLPGVGYPEATLTSTSRSGSVGVQSGTTVYLRAATPPGQRFGSSFGNGYLNLRPAADNAASPSTTTYTFARPAPIGWGFVLGDIDSDQVRVSATRADGSAATVAELGFQETFNYAPGGTDLPTWDPATGTLTGNATGTDTNGASGWFLPTVPLGTLTFTFTWRTGLPVYQTWFGSVSRDITGTVAVTEGVCPVSSYTLSLVDTTDGTVVETVSPDEEGSYAFRRVAASDAFRVELSGVDAPCQLVGPAARAVDLRDDDATADFAVLEEIPRAIGGQVVDESGDPVPGVPVEVTGGAVDRTATTDADGRYEFDALPPGTYTITITPPDGYEAAGPLSQTATVSNTDGDLGVDFTLARVAPTPSPSASPTAETSVSPVASSGSGALPGVGGPSLAWPVAGVLLVVAGGVLLLVSRRRRAG